MEIPLNEFTVENLEKALEGSMMAIMNQYGFSMKNKRINVDQIKKFLGEKFNYWIDDVPHKLIFDIE